MRLVKYSEAYKRYYLKYYKFSYINILINLIMRKGYKLKSLKLVYNFLFKLKLKYKKSINEILIKSFDKYKIIINLIKRKIAGRIYYLPYYISELKSRVLLCHWFIKSVKERKENYFIDRLLFEFFELNLGYGRTIRKIEEFYMLGLRNQPFLYFLKKRYFRSTISLKKYRISHVLL